MKYLRTFILLSIVALSALAHGQNISPTTGTYPPQRIIRFVFCSDLHFGLKKDHFRGKEHVSSAIINAAMLEQINRLPGMVLPADSGVDAGKKITGIDALIIAGDIANREEKGIQAASYSWAEFYKIYFGQLRLKTSSYKKTPILITPGNHDVSNAIGYRKPMSPATDVSSLLGIYNMMMKTAPKKTKKNYQPAIDKTHYSADFGNIHCMFVQLWPDSAERIWMEQDLAKVNTHTPVLVFTHSMPDVEARFFINPNGTHDINSRDKFENLVSEHFKDGASIDEPALIEQRGLVAFLQLHPNIKAYFHGHSNYTEFYDWKGPDSTIQLHCFRVDSPLKGKYSAAEETKLSFELVCINPQTLQMTVRECLWNSSSSKQTPVIKWGIASTVSLQ